MLSVLSPPNPLKKGGGRVHQESFGEDGYAYYLDSGDVSWMYAYI